MTVASPCNGVCTLNDKEVCRGCGRTKEDISKWYILTDDEKQQVLARLARSGFSYVCFVTEVVVVD